MLIHDASDPVARWLTRSIEVITGRGKQRVATAIRRIAHRGDLDGVARLLEEDSSVVDARNAPDETGWQRLLEYMCDEGMTAREAYQQVCREYDEWEDDDPALTVCYGDTQLWGVPL